MKKVSMRKFSLLGLVLIGASAVTAAVLPKNEATANGAGQLVNSNGGSQVTCKQASGVNQCGWTDTLPGSVVADRSIGSRTTSAGGTSSITTTNGNKVATLTTGGPAINTTQVPF